VEITRNGMIVA